MYQLLGEVVSENTDIRHHIQLAENLKDDFACPVSEIDHHISGMLMLISKKTWNSHKFPESGKCLGVDNEYSDRILQAGKKILCHCPIFFSFL